MTAGTKSILKVTAIAAGSAILGAAVSQLGKCQIERLRYDVKSDAKKDADGKVIEYWKTWTPNKK